MNTPLTSIKNQMKRYTSFNVSTGAVEQMAEILRKEIKRIREGCDKTITEDYLETCGSIVEFASVNLISMAPLLRDLKMGSKDRITNKGKKYFHELINGLVHNITVRADKWVKTEKTLNREHIALGHYTVLMELR